MLTGLFVVALISGTMLFWGKWVISQLIFKIFPKSFKRWIYRTPLMMVALDFGFGALAAPVTSIAGGTIAMLTLITFGTWSATYISAHIIIRKGKNWWDNSNLGGLLS